MEMRQLTAWEAKEHAGLLAIETKEWHQKRLVAEDPNTKAEALKHIADDVAAADRIASRTKNDAINQQNPADLVIEALVAHPNTPPLTTVVLLNRFPCPSRAFCNSPIAPFLPLELPDFANRLRGNTIFSLLREEHVPLSIIRAITYLPYPTKGIVPSLDEQLWEVNLHVVLTGEIHNQAEFEEQFVNYWRNLIFGRIVPPIPAETVTGREQQKDDNYFRRINANRFCDLYETGLIPEWLGNLPFAVKPSPFRRMAIAAVRKWLRFETVHGSLEERELWAEIAPNLASQYELAKLLQKNATPDDLARLAMMEKSDESSLHKAIAAHPNTTPDVMKMLLRDERFGRDVQRILTAHPKVSTDIIEILTQSSDAEVRRLARRHSLASANACNVSRKKALDCARREGASPCELLVACLHGLLSVERLVECGVGIASYTRMLAAIGLPATPTLLSNVANVKADKNVELDLLEHLSHDGNRLVRWVAQSRLSNSVFTLN